MKASCAASTFSFSFLQIFPRFQTLLQGIRTPQGRPTRIWDRLCHPCGVLTLKCGHVQSESTQSYESSAWQVHSWKTQQLNLLIFVLAARHCIWALYKFPAYITACPVMRSVRALRMLRERSTRGLLKTRDKGRVTTTPPWCHIENLTLSHPRRSRIVRGCLPYKALGRDALRWWAVVARGEIGREGCEISSLVEHIGSSPWLFL